MAYIQCVNAFIISLLYLLQWPHLLFPPALLLGGLVTGRLPLRTSKVSWAHRYQTAQSVHYDRLIYIPYWLGFAPAPRPPLAIYFQKKGGWGLTASNTPGKKGGRV